jgi:hypothetical protein
VPAGGQGNERELGVDRIEGGLRRIVLAEQIHAEPCPQCHQRRRYGDRPGAADAIGNVTVSFVNWPADLAPTFVSALRTRFEPASPSSTSDSRPEDSSYRYQELRQVGLISSTARIRSAASSFSRWFCSQAPRW